MAIYVRITKKAETESTLTFVYESEGGEGTFELDRKSGQVALTKLADSDPKQTFFRAAAHKVSRAFESGDVPDTLTFAS